MGKLTKNDYQTPNQIIVPFESLKTKVLSIIYFKEGKLNVRIDDIEHEFDDFDFVLHTIYGINSDKVTIKFTDGNKTILQFRDTIQADIFFKSFLNNPFENSSKKT